MSDLDCLRCGACCRVDMTVGVSERDMIAGFDPSLWERDDPKMFRLNAEEEITSVGTLINVEGVCKSLAWIDGEYRCQVYATRPELCAEFEPGNHLCHASRIAVGIDPMPEVFDGWELSELHRYVEIMRTNLKAARKVIEV